MNTEDEDGGWDLEPILPFERETPPVPPAPVSTPKNYPIWGHKGLDAGLSLGQSSWRQMTGWLAVLPSPVLPEASPQSAPKPSVHSACCRVFSHPWYKLQPRA